MQQQDALTQLKSELVLLRKQQIEMQQNYQQHLDCFAQKLDQLSEQFEHDKKSEAISAETAVQPTALNAQTIDELTLQLQGAKLGSQHQDTIVTVSNEKQQTKTASVTTNLDIKSEISSSLLEQYSDSLFASFSPFLTKIKTNQK